MNRMILCPILLFIATLVAGPALAQELIIFPAQGQSNEQMEKDKYDCYQWAKKETGFDPMEIPKATAPPPEQTAKGGGAVKGAAVGAGAGALIKSGGSRSKGAAYGALAGGVLGGARTQSQRRNDEKARQKWEQEQAANYQQKRNTYNRAYAACLEGKGYTVK
jgi:outer membrane lipoprotein SlyB